VALKYWRSHLLDANAVRQRAYRVFRKMSRFVNAESDVVPKELQDLCGPDCLWLYVPDDGIADAIAVYADHLSLRRHDGTRSRLPYASMVSVESPQTKSPDEPRFYQVTIHLKDNHTERIRLCGHDRLSDAFEFSRFLMRVLQNARPSDTD
jgi:hypothetical protein